MSKNALPVYVIFIITFLSTSWLFGNGQEPVIITNQSKLVIPQKKLLILKDDKKSLSLDTVKQLPDSLFMDYSDHLGNTNFGYTDADFWMKFSLEDRLTDHEHWYLVVEYALIDSVEFFLMKDTLVDYSIKGDMVEKDFSTFPQTKHIIPLNIQKGEKYTCYLHFKGNDNKSFPVKMMTLDRFEGSLLRHHIFNALYAGVILAMLLYNFFIFTSIRDRTYLYYSLFAAFMLIAQLALNGYTYWLFFPDRLHIANSSNLWAIGGTAFFGSLFVHQFLHLNQRKKIIRYINLSVAAAGALLFFTALTASYISSIFLSTVKFASFVTFYFIIVIFGIIIYEHFQRAKQARFLLIAWSMYIIGVGITALKYAGILPDTSWTHYSIQVGSMLEITLLSFALADRLRMAEAESRRANEKVLSLLTEKNELMEEQNIVLERKINERTHLISQQKKDLEEYSARLEKSVRELSEQNALIDALFKELNHRVKNNLQFISSLLNLQAKNISDESAKAALQNSRSRIESIATIHKILYIQEGYDKILLRDYVESIIKYLEPMMAHIPFACIRNETGNIPLTIDRAVYVSLIILEVLMNSIKHAFPLYDENNEILISSGKKTDISEKTTISIQDNGKGFDASEKQEGFGLQLISILAQQLNGHYRIENKNGTYFVLEF